MVRGALCGLPGQQGVLEQAHQMCMEAANKYVSCVSDAVLSQVGWPLCVARRSAA